MRKSPLILLPAGFLAWIVLSGWASAASLSGTISCNACSGEGGPILIIVRDGSDPCTSSLVQTTAMAAPGEYTLNGLPDGAELWLRAYWDADGDGTWSNGDYLAFYNDDGPITISGADNTGFDMNLAAPWSPEAGVTATVKNVHAPDGSLETWLEAMIWTNSFWACFPDDLESIVVEGPDGVLPYDEDDFTYLPEWSEFYLIAPGSPAIGRYTITVTARGVSASGSATQDSVFTIPIPDKNSFAIDGRTFSWDLLEYAEHPLYYRLDVNRQGARVHSGEFGLEMNSYTIPAGVLTPGLTYAMRVRAVDRATWDAVRNRAHSDWVPFTWGGWISFMFVQHLETESGESRNRLFFMIRGSDNRYLEDDEGVTDARLYDPNGQEVVFPPPVFSSLALMTADSGADASDWSSSGSFENVSGFEARLPDSLTAGGYRLEVDYNELTLERTFQFNDPASLPIVASSSFLLETDDAGGVTWKWDAPAELCPDSSGQLLSSAIIDVYRGEQLLGEVSVSVPTCRGNLYLPATLVQTLNGMGDAFRLAIQLRSPGDDNRTSSEELRLPAIQAHDPLKTLVKGAIVDAVDGEGVPGARIEFTPGGFVIVAGANGTFESPDIPSGVYNIRVAVDGYLEVNLTDAPIVPAITNKLDMNLEPEAPVIETATANPDAIDNDGSTLTLLTARVSHPVGRSRIASVTVDLSGIGGAAGQAMNDDGVLGDEHAGDGIYSCRASAAEATPVRSHGLIVTAMDDRGVKGSGAIELSVTGKLSGAIQPAQSETRTFVNAIDSQTIRIRFTANRSGAKTGSGRNGDECFVEVTIFKPSGDEYGVYKVYDILDLPIPGAEAGAWRFESENKCETPVNYQIQTQGGGTGMIAGRVVDAFEGHGVTSAEVLCDTGGGAQSLAQGYFVGVVAAGVGTVTTTAADYQVHFEAGVVITAGATTDLELRLLPLENAGQPPPPTPNISVILNPSEYPDPLKQPFAARASDGFLTLEALFPPHQQAMNLHLAMAVDYPGVSGKIFLFDSDNALTDASIAFPAWREGVVDEQHGRVLPPVPLHAFPPAVYTFASMAVPASGTPAGFDLIYFSIPLGQPPPKAPAVTQIPAPLEHPDPAAQPLAARISGGSLIVDAWFPPQQEATTIFIFYQSPGPTGALHMLNSNDEWVVFSGALAPWREAVKTKQAGTVLNRPLPELTPGEYTFYSIVTTDPVFFSNYNLVIFTKTLGSGPQK